MPWSRNATAAANFIEFLIILDAAHPAQTAIEVILDNHFAHISRETASWLAEQPIERFTFTFTPTHGSWLNIIERLLLQTGTLSIAPHPRQLERRTQAHG
jgi:transposase